MSEAPQVEAAAQEATGTVASDEAHDAQAAEQVYSPAGQLQPAAVAPGVVGNYDETAVVFDGVAWQEAGGEPLRLPCHMTAIMPGHMRPYARHARQDVPALTQRQEAEMAAWIAAERAAAELLAEEEQEKAARAAAPAVARQRKGKGRGRRRR